jgi:twitching motility protein PilT
MSIVSQREVGTDTPHVVDALRRAARQDADVIYVGDLPDAESVGEALAAAASGRLVLAVMNTLSAADTIASMVDRFQPHLQIPIRKQLGRTLRGVICQRLVDRADARGRVAVVESLTGTVKVREAIRSGADVSVLERLIAEGDYHGMATFDQALFQLFNDEFVSLDEALDRAAHPEDFRIAVQQAGLATLR